VRGNEIAMIFQEPMTSFGPMHTIGNQIEETILLHLPAVRRTEAWERTVSLLEQMGIARPAAVADSYPHQMSGGMRQRAMIALALSCNPLLLIADEPTTALDVTVQAQILELLSRLQAEYGMAILFITHDLGVIAEIADEVAVMYLGRVVERASVADLFDHPAHPYTRALLQSIPRIDSVEAERLTAIEGSVPDPFHVPAGCAYADRCGDFMPGRCDAAVPALAACAPDHHVRCFLYDQVPEADDGA
jgi:oligopeptide/dipeptide ABC transporter ATP-binding protein